MRSARTAIPRDCSIEQALRVIGERWALLAVREMALGQHRFDDIAHHTGAPRDVLAVRLRSLEAAGVVERRLYQERPPRYEYHLLEAGRQLVSILHAIGDWGDRFVRGGPNQVGSSGQRTVADPAPTRRDAVSDAPHPSTDAAG